MIPCDEQLRSFPMLSAQESSQARQMDRGEIEIEEEKRLRMKRVHVLPRDREQDENENMHASGTDADLATNPVLIQELHSAVGTRQVSHWAKCCSEKMLGLPARHSSTQLGLNDVKGRWQGRARSVRISQVAQVRMLCERPTIQRCLLIACCQRSPTATLTAKVLSCRGMSDAWRTCSVSSRNVTMITTCVFG